MNEGVGKSGEGNVGSEKKKTVLATVCEEIEGEVYPVAFMVGFLSLACEIPGGTRA